LGISSTTKLGLEMVSYFCKTCGTFMYRRGDRMPGVSILRLGMVDDSSLAEGVVRDLYRDPGRMGITRRGGQAVRTGGLR
jgi:hypothetical protein